MRAIRLVYEEDRDCRRDPHGNKNGGNGIKEMQQRRSGCSPGEDGGPYEKTDDVEPDKP
jgi:hypothetical protein